MQSLIPVAIAIATAVAAVSTATIAATRGTLFAGPGLVHANGSAVNVLTIQCVDGLVSLIVIRHFNKSEAFAAVGHFVLYNFAGRNLTVGFKELLKIAFGKTPAQVTNVQVHKKEKKVPALPA